MFVIIDFRFSLLHVHMHHTPSRINICVENILSQKERNLEPMKKTCYTVSSEAGEHTETPANARENQEPSEDTLVPRISNLCGSFHCAVVSVTRDRIPKDLNAPKLMEPDILIHQKYGLDTTEGLLSVLEDRLTQFTVTNNSGFTQRVEAGMLLGRVVNVQEMDSCREFEGSDHSLMADSQETDSCEVWRVEGTNKTKEATVATAK